MADDARRHRLRTIFDAAAEGYDPELRFAKPTRFDLLYVATVA